MSGDERRNKIIKLLEQCSKPISGSELAKTLNVSRQVIVQDIALLRAKKYDIMATARGYMFYPISNNYAKKVIAIQHKPEDIRAELEAIIDNGGRVLDVIVEHDIYGQIKADLMLETRRDIDEFMQKMSNESAVPLMVLTKGMHYHTIEAKNEKILDEIEKAIREKIDNKKY